MTRPPGSRQARSHITACVNRSAPQIVERMPFHQAIYLVSVFSI